MEIYKILLVTISIFLISDFENLVISVISNKISGGAYEIWQQLVTPWLSCIHLYDCYRVGIVVLSIRCPGALWMTCIWLM